MSVNVFSTKVLIGDAFFTSPTGDGTAILRGHLRHAKVQPLCSGKGVPSFFSYFLDSEYCSCTGNRTRDSALQSSALPTELILLRLKWFKSNTRSLGHDFLPILPSVYAVYSSFHVVLMRSVWRIFCRVQFLSWRSTYKGSGASRSALFLPTALE